MVCGGCQNTIFGGVETWGYHCRRYCCAPQTYEIYSCGICSRLQEDLQKIEEVLPPESLPFEQKFYWWTIHRPARLRESPEVLSVTFRPNEESIPSMRGLPTRTFHLREQGTLTVASTLDDRTNSETSITQIKYWIEECNKNHEQCRVPLVPVWTPTRLVSVGSGPEDRIVLVETVGHNFERQYTTLSHCWGVSKLSPILTTQNRDRFMDPNVGIRWSELDRNFQDAISITRGLGIGYIWIDSMCIVQGEGGDFNAEGDLMHKVYRNSFCNLSAAASHDSRGGFFRNRSEQSNLIPDIVKTSESSSIFGQKTWQILSADLWSDRLLNQVLYTRGWAFQERILSPRILHFSLDGIFWDCATTSACEALPDSLPFELDDMAATERHWRERLQVMGDAKTSPPKQVSGTADDSIEAFWKTAVRNYTRCDLTNPEDRTKAIWGVAKLVRDQIRRDGLPEEEYGAGLWTTNLPGQLAWRVVDCSVADRPDILRRYPSWSWASMIGEIDLCDRFSTFDRFYLSNHKGGAVAFRVAEIPEDSTKGPAVDPSDMQPNLQMPYLEVKGNIIPVVVERAILISKSDDESSGQTIRNNHKNNSKDKNKNNNNKWSLRFADREYLPVSATSDNFEVYPDSLSILENDGNALLVVLAASSSKQVSSAYESEDTEEAPVLLHGTGLIVRRDAERERYPAHEPWDHNYYMRMGCFRFRDLTEDDYNMLNPKGGVNFYLV